MYIYVGAIYHSSLPFYYQVIMYRFAKLEVSKPGGLWCGIGACLIDKTPKLRVNLPRRANNSSRRPTTRCRHTTATPGKKMKITPRRRCY
jgi:hypothetical protein